METTILKSTQRTSRDGWHGNSFLTPQRIPYWSLITPPTSTYMFTDARPWRQERQICRPGWTATTLPTDRRWWRLSFLNCANTMQGWSMWQMKYKADTGTKFLGYHSSMPSSAQSSSSPKASNHLATFSNFLFLRTITVFKMAQILLILNYPFRQNL